MIKNRAKTEKFFRKVIKEEKISYPQALRIYEALHREAVRLGVISSKNILKGIDVDIRIAKAIHGLAHG